LTEENVEDMMRLAGAQVGIQEAMRRGEADPRLLAAKQFLVSDPNIMEITSGFLVAPLNVILKYINVMETEGSWKDLNALYEIKDAINEIRGKMDCFVRMAPYQLLLTHLTRVGNLTPEQAERTIRRIRLMIYYDKITLKPEERLVLTPNFWNGLFLLLRNAVLDSVAGWKARIMTTEERRQSIDMPGLIKPEKKKWWRTIF
jgi:hypothetical protein